MTMDTTTTTILSALIAAVVGGTAGAYISARSNRNLARDARRDHASAALWEYHRTLAGFAIKLYVDGGAGEEVAFIGTESYAAVEEAFKAAYPWAGYLKTAVREKVFHEAQFDTGSPPYREFGDFKAADSVNELATTLRKDLERVFPLR
jgi:hypothetical protein